MSNDESAGANQSPVHYTATESYQQHLAELHAKQTVPAEMLNEILAEISSEPVISKQRIIGGEANEVYDISFAGGEQVIVRISRDAAKHFEQERWAIRECAMRGLPVPELLGIWDRSTLDHPLQLCIQRKLAGVLLPHANLSPNVLHEVVVQAGEFLSRIHAIPVKGFGYINGKGEGEFLTPERETEAFLGMEAEFQALAKRLDLRADDMHRALQLIVDEERGVRSIEPCLTHNDFCAKHIMVANGAISGIIDFGEVAGSEPLSDFVRWAYYDAAHFPLAWLQEGYANKQLFDDTFTQRLHVKRIAFSLWAMRWYDLRGYAEGVASARAKFVHDLANLA